MKTIVSRMGASSKLIMAGDDGQIDQPFESDRTCGLNVVVDAFAGSARSGRFFSKRERSKLADLAATLL